MILYILRSTYNTVEWYSHYYSAYFQMTLKTQKKQKNQKKAVSKRQIIINNIEYIQWKEKSFKHKSDEVTFESIDDYTTTFELKGLPKMEANSMSTKATNQLVTSLQNEPKYFGSHTNEGSLSFTAPSPQFQIQTAPSNNLSCKKY